MNILPKKRWHVRTRENIARVRKDEANAKEEERVRDERAKLAEKEARRQLLLQKSRSKFKTEDFLSLDAKEQSSTTTYQTASSLAPSEPKQGDHINIFQELEEGNAELKQTNKDHDKEAKEEREKYEKQIGYLTYLGQDTNEALGRKSWYEEAPSRNGPEKGELNLKKKEREDPLTLIKKLNVQHEKACQELKSRHKFKEYKSILCKDSDSYKKPQRSSSSEDDKQHRRKKHKKHHKKSQQRKSESDESATDDEVDKQEKRRKLEVLRAERLKREREEKLRSEQLLAKIKGQDDSSKDACLDDRRPKYNSQFNPEIAKQNFVRHKKY